MSSVVGVVQGNEIIMGCDSIYYGGGATSNTTSNKIFQHGELLIGCTYSPRVRQLLSYELDIPKELVRGDELEADLVRSFVSPARKLLIAEGIDGKKDGCEVQTGHILIGTQNRLFVVEYDWRVIEPQCGYWAIGSDNGIAMGSLFSTRNIVMGSRQRVMLALEAGEAHSIYIRRPFVVRSLGFDDAI